MVCTMCRTCPYRVTSRWSNSGHAVEGLHQLPQTHINCSRGYCLASAGAVRIHITTSTFITLDALLGRPALGYLPHHCISSAATVYAYQVRIPAKSARQVHMVTHPANPGSTQKGWCVMEDSFCSHDWFVWQGTHKRAHIRTASIQKDSSSCSCSASD